jgi:uncharacterized membrane protein (DUF485 family)
METGSDGGGPVVDRAERIGDGVRLRLVALLVFGTGFGYVEAAVVSYLRRIIGYRSGYQVGARRVYLDLRFIAFVRPDRSVLVDPALTQVEIVREAATLVMLMAIAVVAGQTLRRRLAAFFIAFTVWDLTYYLFLRVLDGWPTSLLDLDVFFLIPVPWVGPVATAVVASSVVLVVSSRVYLARGRGRRDPEPPPGGDRVQRPDRDGLGRADGSSTPQASCPQT